MVSIVVCTYNGERFLERQLDSLISQTYSNIEIIIVDDASSDATVEIAHAYALNDKRIKLYVNEKNLGFNRNFENAFNLATGELIAISDQDDIWKSNKIKDMLPLFDTEQVLLVHSQSVRFKNEIPRVERLTMRNFFEGDDVRKVIYYNTVSGHNIIFRKKLLQYAKPFPENVFYDWWLVVNAVVYGKVRGTDYIYTFHRWHIGNATLGTKNNKTQTPSTLALHKTILEAVLKIPTLKKKDLVFAEKLLERHSTLNGRSFSFPLFFFFVQHCNTIFYFKKRIWSRIKMAFRLSAYSR